MKDFYNKIHYKKIYHKSFGEGVIISLENNYLTIRFSNHEVQKFLFPNCFEEGLLEFVDFKLKDEFDKYLNCSLQKTKANKREFLFEKISNLNLEEELAINTIFEIYSDKEAYDILISATNKILKKYYDDNVIRVDYRKIVIVTLTWLSFDNYEGDLWPYIRRDLKKLYDNSPNHQALEKSIREVISEQEKYADARHITNVLVHAGVPKYFLKKFYDFVYDIYKINFDYKFDVSNEHSEEIDEILLDTLDGVAKSLTTKEITDDLLKIGVTQKTYTLIQSSKLALIHYRKSLMVLMKYMLEIIDYWYYDTSIETNAPKILIEKFEEWKQDNTKSQNVISKNTEYVYKPEYLFNSERKTIKIVFPKYILKGIEKEQFDDISVELLSDGVKQILTREQYKIFEKIGFNTIEIEPQNIEKISEKIILKIKNKEETIITTNEYLNRKFIIFGADGKELPNFKEYNDLVYVAYDKNKIFEGQNKTIISTNKGFNLAVFMAEQNNVYTCGDNKISFSQMLNAGIYGNEIPNLYAYVEEKKIPVFKTVTNFVFESEKSFDKLSLKVNDKFIELDSSDVIKTRRGAYWHYNVFIKDDMYVSNLNNVAIFDKRYLTEVIKSEQFLIDKDLAVSFLKTSDPLIMDIQIISSFGKANRSEEKFSFYDNTFFVYSFRLGKVNITYKFDPFLTRHKWDEKENWNNINEIEINNNKTLCLSVKESEISVLDKFKEKISLSLSTLEKNDYTTVDLSYLKQLKQEHDYLYLLIKDKQRTETIIKLFLNQVVTSHKIFRDEYDNIVIDFQIKNFIKNSLKVNVSMDGFTYLDKTLLNNQIIVETPQVFVDYYGTITEKENLFGGISERTLYKFKFKLYDSTKLINKKFVIKKAYSFRYDDNDLKYYVNELKHIVIFFKEKLEDIPNKYSSFNKDSTAIYRCELYKLDYRNKIIMFNYLNEIFVEITSKKTAAIILFNAEDKDGDGILLSNKKHGYLVDSDDEESDYTIDYFVLDAERDEYK